MRSTALALALALSVSGVASASGFDACDYESDYDLRLHPEGLSFERDGGSATQVEMRRGRLFVDGREVALGAADRERIERYESTVRALVPEVKGIALDAVAIATEAVTQVAAAFAGDEGEAAVTKMRATGARLADRIERADDTRDWNEAEVDRMVAEITSEMVPLLVGDVTSIALKVALTGDESAAKALEARMEGMEKEIEARVERRAEALEARAEALCPRIADLDALESALELRLADNSQLDLLQRGR